MEFKSIPIVFRGTFGFPISLTISLNVFFIINFLSVNTILILNVSLLIFNVIWFKIFLSFHYIYCFKKDSLSVYTKYLMKKEIFSLPLNNIIRVYNMEEFVKDDLNDINQFMKSFSNYGVYPFGILKNFKKSHKYDLYCEIIDDIREQWEKSMLIITPKEKHQILKLLNDLNIEVVNKIKS